MIVFVFEFFSAGAMAGTAVAMSAAPEGQAMLSAVLRDLSRLDGCRTVTCLGPGMRAPHADEAVAASDDWEAVFDSLISRVDYAMIIAPEADGCLARLSEKALAAGTVLMGSSPAAVRTASDKAACSRLFLEAGVASPETVPTTREALASMVEDLGYPVVIKPPSGQDCDGVSLVSERGELDRALCLLNGRETMLLQRYHPGVHASASILVCGSDVTPLCMNEQRVTPGQPFVYMGGATPLAHPLSGRAMELAVKAVGLIPGLNGFVGVDMVLKNDACLVIEINPRVTVAYAGVSRSLDINLAEAILEACAHGVLPQRLGPGRRVEFGKDGRNG